MTKKLSPSSKKKSNTIPSDTNQPLTYSKLNTNKTPDNIIAGMIASSKYNAVSTTNQTSIPVSNFKD